MGHGARIDLAGYLARIGYDGPLSPNVATLHALSAAHVSAIPFNNLDVLLGRPVELALEAVERKLVVEGRGGYCYEQNRYLQRVLTELGFEAKALAGRVRLRTPREVVPPRTHMFLKVEADGEAWLVDAGIGALSLTAAIRLEPGIEQPTPHETRRIVREDGRYFHQALLGGTWVDAYEFTLEELHPIDQEIGNWWISASPLSQFRARLMVARAGDHGTRLSIFNREFTIRRRDGGGSTEEIRSNRQLLAILQEHFGLNFPPDTGFTIPDAPWPG